MQTVADLQQELKKFRSDLPITLCVKVKVDNADLVTSDGHVMVYGPLSVVDAHKIDPKASHARNADGMGLFLTNTPEY